MKNPNYVGKLLCPPSSSRPLCELLKMLRLQSNQKVHLFSQLLSRNNFFEFLGVEPKIVGKFLKKLPIENRHVSSLGWPNIVINIKMTRFEGVSKVKKVGNIISR